MSTSTELAADVARAQRAHDELLAEQQGLPVKLARASRGDSPEEWTALAIRESRLPAEIADAATAVLRATLAERWVDAEQGAPEAAQTNEHLRAVQAQVTAFEQEYPRRKWPRKRGVELAAIHAKAGALQEELDLARIAYSNADHVVALALYDIGQLEDRIEIATGDRPETDGAGLRAPTQTLARTYVLTAPDGRTTDTFLGGTVPPRWAQWRLRHNHQAFTDAQPWTSTRPSQDPRSFIGETQHWGASPETHHAETPQNIGQFLRSDSLFTHPQIERGTDVFKPASRSTLGRNVRAKW